MPRSFATALGLALAAAPALAQQDHAQMGRMPSASPYTALQAREIKALSDTQIAQYRNGEGIGFALAAELNHYPGPLHALAFADSLALTSEQRQLIGAQRMRMVNEARRLGEQIVEQERALDRAFAGGAITEPQLRSLTAEIARLQGELRFVHLRAHLAIHEAMSEHQVQRYDALRGYAAGGEHAH